MDVKEFVGLPLGIGLLITIGIFVWRWLIPLTNRLVIAHFTLVKELIKENRDNEKEIRREFLEAMNRRDMAAETLATGIKLALEERREVRDRDIRDRPPNPRR